MCFNVLLISLPPAHSCDLALYKRYKDLISLKAKRHVSQCKELVLKYGTNILEVLFHLRGTTMMKNLPGRRTQWERGTVDRDQVERSF